MALSGKHKGRMQKEGGCSRGAAEEPLDASMEIGERKGILRFCPHRYVRSVLDVAPQELWERGFRGVILDLDNTLVRWQKEEIEAELANWIESLKQLGIRICLLSNSLRTGRSQRIARRFGIEAVGWARKPSRSGFRRALEALGTSPAETVIIGDQMFTDIFGGNRMGLYTIMVQPLHPHEFLYTRFVSRPPERLLLWYFRRRGHLKEARL